MATNQKKKTVFNAEFHLSGVPKITIALSIKHLSLMLRAGLSLAESVKVLAEQSSDARLQKIYESVHQSIQEGNSLADSLSKHKKTFSDIIIAIIAAGEQGGTLEKNLMFLSEYLKKSHSQKKKISGALMYPSVVFLLALGEMFGLIFFILPKLQDLFKDLGEVPKLTQVILDTSSFVRNNIIFIVIGLSIFLVLFRFFLKSKTGKKFKDTLALNFPIIKKLTKSSTLSTFSRTLNILIESGVPLVQALEITSATISNYKYSNALTKIHADVKRGINLADALNEHSKLFPSTFVKLIEIGEKTGSLEENLFFLYEYHDEEVADITDNLSTLLEPIMLILIGGMIGLLAFVIISPIYQFTGSINPAE